jgi:hypothetical protein
MTVAALYVQKGGSYWNLLGVDAWDQERDARQYNGPWPVVAHPPCERWGAFWSGAFGTTEKRFALGDDGGCFASALASVRAWGGVLEHPNRTRAYAAFGLAMPPAEGGWVRADEHGWCCQVEQGNYGHEARKPTWLYSVGCDLPALIWGASAPPIPQHRSERWRARAAKDGVCVLLSKKQRAHTPAPFRDLLIGMARSVRRAAA